MIQLFLWEPDKISDKNAHTGTLLRTVPTKYHVTVLNHALF